MKTAKKTAAKKPTYKTGGMTNPNKEAKVSPTSIKGKAGYGAKKTLKKSK
jgi:hypothetical protein